MDNFQLSSIVKGIHEKDGICYSDSHSQISYPDEGNHDCMQVEDNSFWFAHRNRCIISLVKHFSNEEVFWDIGGGNGFVARGLQQNSIESVLVEPGIAGALNARDRGIKNVICSTLENIELVPGAIKAAGMFDVIEHIENDVEFLSTVGKSMEPAGMVYITVPAFKFIWSKDDDYAGHFRRYTIKSANKLMTDSGFEPFFSSYLFFPLPLPIFLLRSLPSIFGIKQKEENSAKNKREHTGSGIIHSLLEREYNLIRILKTVPFGSSCLVVGKKK